MDALPEFPGTDALLGALGLNAPPRLGVVLGSGQSEIASRLGADGGVAYGDVPGLRACTVAGHAGRASAATLGGRPVLVFQGRFHRYEGRGWGEVVAPVELLHRLGCGRVLLTTSCGGINENLRPGDAVAIVDHINMQGTNPVIELAPFDARSSFLDLSGAWFRPDAEALAQLAERCGIRVFAGVAASMLGPVYETPAEVRMLRALGADVVNMSTAPEAIWAAYRGVKCAGLALVTNAACSEGVPVSHTDVVNGAASASQPFAELVAAYAELFLAS